MQDVNVSTGHQPIPLQVKVLQAENRRLKDKLEELADELMWRDKITSNPHLSASERIVAIAARQELARLTPAADGLTRIYIPNMVARTGLSDDTVGKNIKRLADSGLMSRRVDPKSDGTHITKSLHIALSPQLLVNPEGVSHEEARNHGGKRIRCQSCGSDNLEKLTRITCKDCGEIHSEKRAEVNGEQEGEEYVHPIFEPSYPAPDRACFVCGTSNWVAGASHDSVFWQCGTCHPQENMEVVA